MDRGKRYTFYCHRGNNQRVYIYNGVYGVYNKGILGKIVPDFFMLHDTVTLIYER